VPDADYYVPCDFLTDLKRRPATYGFKSTGRMKDPVVFVSKGDLLMPGAYNLDDITKR
jgi:hypothetical protein